MRSRRQQLVQRQRQLLVRSDELRTVLGEQAQILRSPLAVADQVRAAVHWLREHRVWPVLSVVLIALRRPARSLRWASRLWKLWSYYKTGRSWFYRTLGPEASRGETAGTAPSGGS